MIDKKSCKGCASRSPARQYDGLRDYINSIDLSKYPTFAKYERSTLGALSAYILELTLQGYSDNEMPIKLHYRWAYLFEGMTFEIWQQVVAEFREYQEECA